VTVNRLIVAAPLVPVAAAVIGLVMLRIRLRNTELQQRILSATGLAPGPDLAASASITRAGVGGLPGWKDRAAALFGFKLAKRDQYPLSWFWVIGAAVLIGRVAVLLAAPLVGSVAWAMLPFVAIMLSRTVFARSDSKRKLLLQGQLPDALGLIVRAVRVGVPVSEALRAVARELPAPTGPVFRQLAEQIAIGVSLDAALREMANINDLAEYGFFAAALGLQAQTGGGLTETLDLLADVTRKRVALRARGRALSAEARMSALVLGILPFVMMGLLQIISPAYLGVLFYTGTGHTLLGIAALLLTVGGVSMQTIIQKSALPRLKCSRPLPCCLT